MASVDVASALLHTGVAAAGSSVAVQVGSVRLSAPADRRGVDVAYVQLGVTAAQPAVQVASVLLHTPVTSAVTYRRVAGQWVPVRVLRRVAGVWTEIQGVR